MARPLGLWRPALPAVAGHIHGQFQPAPDAQLVESRAQMVLDDLFAGADDLADLLRSIGERDDALRRRFGLGLDLGKALRRAIERLMARVDGLRRALGLLSSAGYDLRGTELIETRTWQACARWLFT